MRFMFIGEQGRYPQTVINPNNNKIERHIMAGQPFENPPQITIYGVRFPLNVPVEVNEQRYCLDRPGEAYSKVKVIDKLAKHSHFARVDDEVLDSGRGSSAGSEGGQPGAQNADSRGAAPVQPAKRRGRPPKNMVQPPTT